MSQSQLDCFCNERDILPPYTDVPVTTNLNGRLQPLDYRAWPKEMDVISWIVTRSPTNPRRDAFMHDSCAHQTASRSAHGTNASSQKLASRETH